mgnify:CR=1 FL=1
MIVRPHLHWFRLLFVWRGSVLPHLMSRLGLVLMVSVVPVHPPAIPIGQAQAAG